MSSNIVVDLRERKWKAIHGAIVNLKECRVSVKVYATFLVDSGLAPQVYRLVFDYDLDDVCEIQSVIPDSALDVMSAEEFEAWSPCRAR